jgi:predicted permease
LVLLSGAGLMVRSFLLAQNEFAEMTPARILTTRVNLPTSRYPEPASRQRFFEKLSTRLAALPGLESVALISNQPGSGGAGWHFETEGKVFTDAQHRPAVTGVVASKGYLKLLGKSLLRGRDFDDTDGMPGKEAVIVTEAFASRHFPKEDALGKQIRLYTDGNKARPWMTVVGIAPNIRQRNPAEQSQDPVIFVSYRFESYGSMAVLLKAQGSPAALTSAVRNEVQQIDRDLPLFDVMVLQEQFERQRWYLRVFGTLFALFALIALGMAAMGIYAVVAHAAARRTREIGVRMALGAGMGTILKLVLGRGLKQLSIGTVLGLAAAIAVCRLMSGFLFGVSSSDPITFIAVTLTLAAAGLAATWFPALRAARLDPVKALRYE